MKKTLVYICILLSSFLLSIRPQAFCQTDSSRRYDRHQTLSEDDDKEDGTTQNVHRKKLAVPKPAIGIEVGISDAGVIGRGTFQYTTDVIGWRLGAFVYIPVSGKFCIQPGLFYSVGGGGWTNSDQSNIEYWHVHTIEVPVSFGFHYDGRHHRKYKRFIGLGPYLGYNMSATYSSSNSSERGSLRIGNGIYDDIKPFDYGLVLNVATEWRNGLFLRARFQGGIADLSPSPYDNVSTFSIGVQFGYLFGEKPHKHKYHKDDNYIERRGT